MAGSAGLGRQMKICQADVSIANAYTHTHTKHPELIVAPIMADTLTSKHASSGAHDVARKTATQLRQYVYFCTSKSSKLSHGASEREARG